LFFNKGTLLVHVFNYNNIMNSSGKVLAIFLVITAVLLISLTAISLFFFQKETERRKLAEATLEEFQIEKTKIDEELTDFKKNNFLLQEKNKEAEARVNDLSDELELESGLREEMKLETVLLEEKLKELEEQGEAFALENEEKEELHKQLTKNLSQLEQNIKELRAQLKAEQERSQKLGQLYEQKQQEEDAKSEVIEKSRLEEAAKIKRSEEEFSDKSEDRGVELEEIVIIPSPPNTREVQLEPIVKEAVSALETALNGRILSVDIETEFVIVSLGQKDGIAVGNVLSVYRNDIYVGDIKVTRLQLEMSAADLVLPLSIRKIRKDDLVKTK